MKKNNKILIVVLACVIIAGIVCFVLSGKKPFKNFSATNVESATVLLIPNETIKITDIEELTGYLRDVVIYNEDNSYTEYSGQGVIFTLAMTDGTQVEVEAYNTFIVIDGVGYKCKYEPCKALSNYANRFLMDSE
jgi:hypothetical protein